MIIVARHANGNEDSPLEYVKKNGKIKEFESEFDAREYLMVRGLRASYIDSYLYLDIESIDDIKDLTNG